MRQLFKLCAGLVGSLQVLLVWRYKLPSLRNRCEVVGVGDLTRIIVAVNDFSNDFRSECLSAHQQNCELCGHEKAFNVFHAD